MGCAAILGSNSKACSEGVFNVLEKLLALNFMASAIMCMFEQKKVHRHGGFFGMVGTFIYAIFINNPVLILKE